VLVSRRQIVATLSGLVKCFAVIKPHFVLYDLRHTFATRAVAAGVDLPTLSAMLGHTSITMTMRYVHPAAEQKRLAAAKLENFRINGLIEAASEQAVGAKMGSVSQVH
jgi:integrase